MSILSVGPVSRQQRKKGEGRGRTLRFERLEDRTLLSADLVPMEAPSLTGTTKIRFQPVPDFIGVVDAALTFRAWDQTNGVNGGVADTTTNDGASAFSTAVETASIAVTSFAAGLDVDGNGALDPLSDGILILRYLFDPTGDWNVSDALGAVATRTSLAEIKTWLDQCNPNLLASTLPHTLEGHYVNWIAFSKDGSLMATAGNDGIAQIRDGRTGQLLHTLLGHTQQVRQVAFSPDSGTVATVSFDQTIKFWDPMTGALLRSIDAHTDRIQTVAFSPNGALLATGANDQLILVRDAVTTDLVQTLVGHTERVRSVVFSADGRTLASGAMDGTVKLWDVETWQCQKTFDAHGAGVLSVALSPDGTRLAAGYGDGKVRIWDILSGQVVLTPAGHQSVAFSVAYSPNGQFLASASEDMTVRLWRADDGSLVRSLDESQGEVCAAVFSPDGRTLVSGGFDRTIRCWNVAQLGTTALDPDGNGSADALSDGILILRYLFDPDGAWSVDDAIGGGATRTTRAEIKAWLDQYASGFSTMPALTTAEHSVDVSEGLMSNGCDSQPELSAWPTVERIAKVITAVRDEEDDLVTSHPAKGETDYGHGVPLVLHSRASGIVIQQWARVEIGESWAGALRPREEPSDSRDDEEASLNIADHEWTCLGPFEDGGLAHPGHARGDGLRAVPTCPSVGA